MPKFTYCPNELCHKFENEFICVKYRNSVDSLELLWIETESEYQGQSHATNILNEIVDSILNPDQKFIISTPDSDVLGFYTRWLNKRGLSSQMIWDCISDDDTGFTITLSYPDFQIDANRIHKNKF